MPRHAVDSWSSLRIVIALGAAFAVACGDDEGSGVPDSGQPGQMDASQDAAMDAAMDAEMEAGPSPTDAGDDGAEPWQGWDGSSGFIDLKGEICVLRVAAQCDGPEDCAEGECCGARFEPTAVSYTAIGCSKECDFQRTFPLCHEGQVCNAAGDRVCRTSILLPTESIGVCLPPATGAPKPTGDDVSGEINCGEQQCVVGAEQCCLREGFNVDTFQSVPYEAYCAPIGEPCDCGAPSPPPDAGAPDAGPIDDDAGAD